MLILGSLAGFAANGAVAEPSLVGRLMHELTVGPLQELIISWVGDEDERGLVVEVAADEPGAGGAVDVDAFAGGPDHGDSSVAAVSGWVSGSVAGGRASASTAARAWSRSGGRK